MHKNTAMHLSPVFLTLSIKGSFLLRFRNNIRNNIFIVDNPSPGFIISWHSSEISILQSWFNKCFLAAKPHQIIAFIISYELVDVWFNECFLAAKPVRSLRSLYHKRRPMSAFPRVKFPVPMFLRKCFYSNTCCIGGEPQAKAIYLGRVYAIYPHCFISKRV